MGQHVCAHVSNVIPVVHGHWVLTYVVTCTEHCNTTVGELWKKDKGFLEDRKLTGIYHTPALNRCTTIYQYVRMNARLSSNEQHKVEEMFEQTACVFSVMCVRPCCINCTGESNGHEETKTGKNTGEIKDDNNGQPGCGVFNAPPEYIFSSRATWNR